MQFSNSIASLVRILLRLHRGFSKPAQFYYSFSVSFVINIKTAESRPPLFVSGTNLRDGKFSSDNLIIPSYSRRAGGEEGPEDHQGISLSVLELEQTRGWQGWFWQSSSSTHH